MNGDNKSLRNRRDALGLRTMIEPKRAVRTGAFRPKVPAGSGDARVASRERIHHCYPRA